MNGKLTTQWRLENNELDRINLSDIDFFWRRLRNSKKNKNQHEETLNNACSSNLPETWLNTKIGNVFDVHVGSTPRRNQPEFWNGDIPWVSSSEVAFCRIYATKEMITKKGLASSSTKIHPAGTVMLAMIGQGKTRGQVAILNIDACHNQNTAAIRVPGDFASSEFLYFYLSQRYNDNRGIGAGNNQKAMNKSIVESLIFPLPPLKEQHEIVRRVEQLFAYADTIEKQVNNALTRVNNLTQSILAKAFRGELTAQWRAENPDLISGENSAAALLEKIKAERAASGGKKTSRKKV
ncbi:TPA: restriction endonuclease subunit S [Salmonella enterica]|nr:restriction endonuclease subunit S [Salmonella enterica]